MGLIMTLFLQNKFFSSLAETKTGQMSEIFQVTGGCDFWLNQVICTTANSNIGGYRPEVFLEKGLEKYAVNLQKTTHGEVRIQ